MTESDANVSRVEQSSLAVPLEGCNHHCPKCTLHKFIIHNHVTLLFFPQALQFQNKTLTGSV